MIPNPLSQEDRKRLIRLSGLAVQYFNAGDWQLLDLQTGDTKLIARHDRLLRSLSFGDPDYEGNAHRVLFDVVEHDPANLEIIERFIAERYAQVGALGENVSTALGKSRSIIFSPSVFEVPEESVDPNLVAVMMPFAPDFDPVFEAILNACLASGYRGLRAKDIWQHSVVIQDVFSLIFRSHIVVCDFTGKNANVFYEAGIAHTLGKHVVPITQSVTDIPFDLQHHRYLPYLNNAEGRDTLATGLTGRFVSLR